VLDLMQLAVVHLIAGPGVTRRDLEPEIVVDIVWAAAVPADRLEYVRARTRPGGIDLVLFHRSGPGAPASVAARLLIDRARANAPPLRGWIRSP
jgi:hypothetical protein